MSLAADVFLEGAVRTATPLALAALGEMVAERAGVINIGLEGAIIAGAFGALVGATAAPDLALAGWAAAALGGLAASLVFAVFAVVLRAEQIIAGTATTLLALGATGLLYRVQFGDAGAALRITTAPALPIPGLASLPLVGPALFAQPAPTYLVYALVPLLAWTIRRTHVGLSLRACGESPEAARAAGIAVRRVRVLAVLFGGLLGGLAGGTLVLAQVGTFAEGMSAGRGFIAIAVVALGRWQAWGVALAALLFGAASALQFLFQAMGWGIPYQVFLALPYVLTLAALAVAGARGARRLRGVGVAPAALGTRDDA